VAYLENVTFSGEVGCLLPGVAVRSVANVDLNSLCDGEGAVKRNKKLFIVKRLAFISELHETVESGP